MLEGLVETIEILQERIRSHGAKIGKNEIWTRVALIDPLLDALGWDTADPSVVEIEPKVNEGWADYALLGQGGNRLMFIEAKRAEDSRPAVLQTATYTFTYNTQHDPKVGHCAWTNGKEWVVWDVFKQDPVLEVSLSRDSAAQCGFKLVGLWRGSFGDGVMRFPVASIWKQNGGDSPPPPDAGWIALDASDLKIANQPAPVGVRFSDGSTHTIQYWYEVFGRVANWLFGQGILTGANAGGKFGGNVTPFGRDGQRFDGKRFRKAVSVDGSDLQYDAHGPARQHVKRAILVLKHLGQDPAGVALRLAGNGS